jgi:folylpolyglutamate synthase/dihydropteroate synthase
MAPSLLMPEFSRHGVEAMVTESVPAALSLALDMAEPRDLICAAGSLFVVGETIEAVNRRGLPLKKD